GFAEFARQLDAHVRVVAEAAGCAQLLDRYLGALDECVLEPTACILLAQVGKRQSKDVGRKQQASGEGGEAQHGVHACIVGDGVSLTEAAVLTSQAMGVDGQRAWLWL